MATTTTLDTLKINYLTQAQYDAAVTAGTINSDEIYMTPASGRAYCYAATFTATSISAQNTLTQVPIASIDIANNFSYDSTNKGLKCEKAGRYMVSVWLSTDSTVTSGDIYGVQVKKNNNDITTYPTYHRLAGTYDHAQMPPTYVGLAVGDVLTVWVRNNSAARGKVDGSGSRIAVWEVG